MKLAILLRISIGAMSLVLAACGSRSPLQSPRFRADASPGDDARTDGSAPDGGPRGGFPCMWSLGSAVEVARSNDRVDVYAAVHGDSAEAVVTAVESDRAGSTLFEGLVLTLASPPEPRIEVVSSEGGAPLGRPGGYVQVASGRSRPQCRLIWRDTDFAAVARARGVSVRRCRGTRTVSSLELAGTGADRTSVRIERWALQPAGEPQRRFELELGEADPVDAAQAVAMSDGGTLAVVRAGSQLMALHAGPDGAIRDRRTLSMRNEAFRFANVPEAAGGVLLRKSSGGSWRLARLGTGGLEPEALTDLTTLDTAPADARLAVSDEEVLLALEDGSVLAVLLGGGSRSRVEAPRPSAPDAVTVALRPGRVTGLVAHAHEEDGAWVTKARPLVCNR